jgi:FtsH-binding integral membrane protein
MNTAYSNTFENQVVADALPEERVAFIRKTYLHLAGAIGIFVLLEGYLIMSGKAYVLAETMLGTRYSWLIVLVAFMGVSWIADRWANSNSSIPLQYLGLTLFTIAETIIFAPLMFMAVSYSGGGYETLAKAGIVTIGLFLGLTAVVLMTRKDFSFLGPILMVGSFVALGFIVSGIAFGFNLGSIFSFAMVAFAGGAILYDTSNILHRYNTNQHVAAALSLFASVALLFWYIIRIFMNRN